jgi:acyl carrier protein
VSTSIADIKTAIRAFLEGRLGTDTFGDEDDLFGTGLVNSLFALELVLFVENEFGLTVENEDLQRDDFRSVSTLAQLVLRKRDMAE